MNQQEFKENLQFYGTDLTSWPANLGLEAQQGLEQFSEWRIWLEQEKSFEGFLRMAPIPEPSLGFEERLLNLVISHRPENINSKESRFNWFWEFFSSKPALAGAFALLLLGFYLGFSSKFSFDQNEEESIEVASIFGEDLWD